MELLVMHPNYSFGYLWAYQ